MTSWVTLLEALEQPHRGQGAGAADRVRRWAGGPARRRPAAADPTAAATTDDATDELGQRVDQQWAARAAGRGVAALLEVIVAETDLPSQGARLRWTGNGN